MLLNIVDDKPCIIMNDTPCIMNTKLQPFGEITQSTTHLPEFFLFCPLPLLWNLGKNIAHSHNLRWQRRIGTKGAMRPPPSKRLPHFCPLQTIPVWGGGDILYNVRENDIAEKKLLKTFVWFFFLGGGQNVAAKWGGRSR